MHNVSIRSVREKYRLMFRNLWQHQSKLSVVPIKVNGFGFTYNHILPSFLVSPLTSTNWYQSYTTEDPFRYSLTMQVWLCDHVSDGSGFSRKFSTILECPVALTSAGEVKGVDNTQHVILQSFLFPYPTHLSQVIVKILSSKEFYHISYRHLHDW